MAWLREEFKKLFDFSISHKAANLDVLGKVLVELLEIVLVFGKLIEKLHAFFDQILPNHFQDL